MESCPPEKRTSADHAPHSSSTSRPSRRVTRRSMRAASSRLCVATRAASPVAAQLRQRAKDMVGGVRIEIAGGLVGQQQRGALATARAMATRCCSPPDSSAGRWVSRRRGRDSPAVRRRARDLGGQAADQLRHHHVFQRRELRQQVMELVDEADLVRRSACGAIVHMRGRRRRYRPRRRRAAPAVPQYAAAWICPRPTARSARPTGPARARDRRRAGHPAVGARMVAALDLVELQAGTCECGIGCRLVGHALHS